MIYESMNNSLLESGVYQLRLLEPRFHTIFSFVSGGSVDISVYVVFWLLSVSRLGNWPVSNDIQ